MVDCDVCAAGHKLPMRYHGLDCPKRQPAKRPRRQLERELEQQCSGILAFDGWRAIVTDPPHLRGLGVSEKGIPDRLYIRYRSKEEKAVTELIGRGYLAIAEVLWIEWKAPDGRLSIKQKEWHELERKRGALIWVPTIDFPATFEGFKAHYAASGLARRKS